MEQELPTLPELLSLPPGFSGVRVTRSLALCVCFVDRCESLCSFSFDHCVVCPSSIYGLWLPLWYLQTLLTSVARSSYTCICLIRDTNCLSFASTWVHPNFCGVCVDHLFSFLCYVLSVFVLCRVYPMLPVSLDCPFCFL